jgi:hypothetical protein
MVLLIALAGLLAGGVAAISGFGIGSLLTPLLALETGTKVAVAAVSIPHFAATALRFWMMRRHVDRPLLLHFGLLSAAGGLLGALVFARAANLALTLVFAALLIFAGFSGLTGYAARLRFGRRAAWVAGAASGFLGGLVGNQGGIRSAALLGFNVERHAFVATATAAGLIVDTVRIPIYLAGHAANIREIWPLVVTAMVAALAGTVLGARLLRRIPELWFRRAVSALILVLGIAMALAAATGRQ